jgi:hypothetical protein
MTRLTRPGDARLFIVGYNQAISLPVASTESHDEYIDALFDRNTRSCCGLYKQVRGSKRSSQTRENSKKLSERLAKQGITDVIETNVICYATRMGANLNEGENPVG